METLLKQLKLARIREVLDEWLRRAAEEEMSYADFLKALLMEENHARKENQLKRYRRQANFPFEKTIEQFDFSLRPGLKRQVFLNLLDIRFVHQARSLILLGLLGPSGTGKTHLAIAVAMHMIQLGYQAKFILAQKLVNDYVNQPENRTKMLANLAKVDLLIIDEFGYLPYDTQAGPLFYQIISDRHEKKATIITSNKSLRTWPEVLHDVSLAGALVDRLMERGEVFYLRGDSYRLRGKEKYLEESVASSALSSTSSTG